MRGGIATLLALLFAVGSIISVHPDIHAALHPERPSKHSHADETEHHPNESSEDSEGCFLCEVANGGIELVDCGAALLAPTPVSRPGRIDALYVYVSNPDRRLPPILGPPLA